MLLPQQRLHLNLFLQHLLRERSAQQPLERILKKERAKLKAQHQKLQAQLVRSSCSVQCSLQEHRLIGHSTSPAAKLRRRLVKPR